VRNFLIFCLVVVLVLGAGVARSFDKEDVELKVLEFDPYFVLPIPEKTPEKFVDFSSSVGVLLQVVNHTQTTIQAGYESATLEIVNADDQVLPLPRDSNQGANKLETYCQLVEPKKETFLLLSLDLKWQGEKLTLINWNGSHNFDDIKPGLYRVRTIYNNPGGTISCLDNTNQKITVKNLGAGRGATNFIPLRIVHPYKVDRYTVEIDGIWYETVLSHPVATVPPKSEEATTPFLASIRITNQTSTPRFFGRADSLMPTIIGANDQLLPPEEGGRAGGGGEVCELIHPGESKTFSWKAQFHWQDNSLYLAGNDNFAYYSVYKDVKPGRYRIAINYFPSSISSKCIFPSETSNSAKPVRLSGSKGLVPYVPFILSEQPSV